MPQCSGLSGQERGAGVPHRELWASEVLCLPSAQRLEMAFNCLEDARLRADRSDTDLYDLTAPHRQASPWPFTFLYVRSIFKVISGTQRQIHKTSYFNTAIPCDHMEFALVLKF